MSSAAIHRRIGAGSDVLMQELIGQESDEAKAAWRRHFDDLKDEVAVFPGAADLLRAVRAKGPAVMLATSSEPADVETLLCALDAADAITGVTSAGDVDQAKPSPEVFEAALEQVGCSPGAALVVGDTPWDVEAAKRAGLRCVGFTSGGRSHGELTEAGAIAVYDGPADLLAALDASPLSRLWA